MKGFEYPFSYGVVILIGFALCCQPQATQRPANPAPDTVNLAGVWNFKPDPQNVGEKERWFEHILPHKIALPGSMAANGFGEEISVDTR